MLEDALLYDPPRFSDTPVNAFFTDDRGLGPRRFKEGVCWGATLTPDTFPPRAGGTAVLSVAVFKREGESAEDGPGDEALPVVLTRVGSLYESDFVGAGSLLRGCSWVLAIPADPSRSPRWFKIMSSWSWAGAGGQTTRLILRNQEEFDQLTGATAAGRTATVFAFEGIVRVDEQTVTLN